jgi:hypothetical protein
LACTGTVCGVKPSREKVTEKPPLVGTSSVHGVRQLVPSEVFASTPCGSESSSMLAVAGIGGVLSNRPNPAPRGHPLHPHSSSAIPANASTRAWRILPSSAQARRRGRYGP